MAKRPLITEAHVREALKAGTSSLTVAPNALITPLAPDQPVVRVGARNVPPSNQDDRLIWASVGAYLDSVRQRVVKR